MPSDAANGPLGPPPGWYPDPTGLQVLRWWDGGQWGPHTQPLPGIRQEPRLPYPDASASTSGGYGTFQREDAGRHRQQSGPRGGTMYPPGLASDPNPASSPADRPQQRPFTPGPQYGPQSGDPRYQGQPPYPARMQEGITTTSTPRLADLPATGGPPVSAAPPSGKKFWSWFEKHVFVIISGIVLAAILIGLAINIAAHTSQNPSYALGYNYGRSEPFQSGYQQSTLAADPSQSLASIAHMYCAQMTGSAALSGLDIGPSEDQWVKGCAAALLTQ
jgi:hypothetical protein